MGITGYLFTTFIFGLIIVSLALAFKNKLPCKNNGFTQMNETLRNKKYPDGYWAYAAKNSGGIAIIISGLIISLVGALFAALVVYLVISALREDMAISGSDMGFLIFLLVFAAITLIPGILLLRYGIKRKMMNNADAWIKESAEISGYPEGEIREFGNQALASDTFYFTLDGKGGAPGSTGFLTRDYIMFENFAHMCVIKIEDISKAYFYECENISNVSTGNVGKSIRMHTFSLKLAIISRQDTWCIATVQKKIADELVARLLEHNPNIETADGRIWNENEWNVIWKDLLQKNKARNLKH